MTILKDISVENAKLQFRNFSGKAGDMNPEGSRNFCVLLDTDVAQHLQEDGWNIKWLKPRDPQEDPQAYLPVAVNYRNRPPRIILITSKNKTTVTEETVGMLDWAEIGNVDVIIHPYNWEMRGKTGVKAYVSVMYVTIVEDEFASKYENVPDSAANAPDDD